MIMVLSDVMLLFQLLTSDAQCHEARLQIASLQCSNKETLEQLSDKSRALSQKGLELDHANLNLKRIQEEMSEEKNSSKQMQNQLKRLQGQLDEMQDQVRIVF